MMFLNVLSLVYTAAKYKIYSMYDKSKDETLIYVGVHDIFAHNLKIKVVNPETKVSVEFKNEDVEKYVRNNYPQLLNHPFLMYSLEKYRYGLFGKINSDMIINGKAELHFNLLDDTRNITLVMNDDSKLNLLNKFFLPYRYYFDELSHKFNDVCIKIGKLERKCNELRLNINYCQYLLLHTAFDFVFKNISDWKKKIEKDKVTRNIRELTYTSGLIDSLDINHEENFN